jgi:methionyl-tRNA formyltransferase
VKRLALEMDLHVLQPDRARDPSFVQAVGPLAPDVIVAAAYGQLIPRAMLDAARVAPVNVHASLLPAYRGAAPIQRALLDGAVVTGVTTMWMDSKLDTGDILLAAAVAVRESDNAGDVAERLSELGAELLLRTLAAIEDGTCPRRAQDASLASYAPPVTASDAVIRWDVPASSIDDRIRAMAPRPGAVASWHGRRLKIWSAERSPQSGLPGQIIWVDRHSVLVAAGAGSLRLTEVQPENAKRMSASEWARGARVGAGDAFDAETRVE